MAKLWITELQSMGSDRLGNTLPVPAFPAVVSQTPITLGATAQSAAFNAATRYLRLRSDGICHYVVGANPTATVNDTPLDANSVEYIGVSPGMKLAVITG